MGPRRHDGELLSTFRFRYARYCLAWLAGLGTALALLLFIQPNALESSIPLLIMFLYFGLPIGAGTALLALVGFTFGGIGALAVERNSTAAFWWPRVKETLRFLVLAPLGLFALYIFSSALRKLEVPMFSRRITHTFYFDSEPVAFLVVLAVWGGVGFGLLFYLIRRWRRTYAI